MKPFRKPGFKGIGRAAGSAIGKIAVKTYVCHGCGLQHKGVERGGKKTCPEQCLACGRMDFATFDSTGEAGYWATLQLKERAGLISDLRRQVRFDLMAVGPHGLPVKVAAYVADYVFQRDGERHILDWKGAITDVAALKLKWMAAQGMPVQIVTAKGMHNG